MITKIILEVSSWVVVPIKFKALSVAYIFFKIMEGMNTLVESLYHHKFLLEFSPLGVLKMNFEGSSIMEDMRACNGDLEVSFETRMVLFYELFWAQLFVVYNFSMLRCHVDQVSQMQKLLAFKETIEGDTFSTFGSVLCSCHRCFADW